jgi:two-component system sensor histidine kinase QseC
MLSIKARLVLLTMLSIAAIFSISGTAIYYFERNNSLERFDLRLRVLAYSIMTATYQKRDEKVEVHFTDRFLHEFNSNQKRAFYQIWKNDDQVVKRSDSLAEKDLPKKFGKEREPKYWDLELPNGLNGRAIGVRYEPRVRGNKELDYNKGFRLILVVATDVHEIENSLAELRNLLLLGGIATLALSPFFVLAALNRGLDPLKGLAGRMGKVDASSLETHIDEGSLPAELRPIAKQLNELFSRLQKSFERERQFSADVSHELRTPISAMLNIAEVGIKWKEEESKQDYEAIRAIAEEMQRTVSQLMDLSRADSGELELLIEPVSIGEVVHSTWNRYEAKAGERNLNVSLADFEGILWDLDRSLFERVVDNLIENAVCYSTEGGDIEISMSSEQTGLFIRNRCSGLKESDLDKLFHRFWRNDSARSSSMHSGLGLSVAAAFSQLLGLRLEASLESGDIFEMRLMQH